MLVRQGRFRLFGAIGSSRVTSSAAAARKGGPDLCENDAAAWHDRLEGTNINQSKLLATDYLNHFNEVVLLIEMLPSAPGELARRATNGSQYLGPASSPSIRGPRSCVDLTCAG